MIKISLCDNCKDNKGVVNCPPETCECDCHYEIDMLLQEECERRKKNG